MLQLVEAPAPVEAVLIDLGDLGDFGESPGEPRRERALMWRSRVESLIAVALLAVFVLAGAAPPTPGPIGALQSVPLPAGRFVVIDDALYAGMDGRLVAFSLATGQLRWRSAVEVREDFAVHAAGGVVLVSAPEHGWRTSAVDVATGARRWQFAGVPLQIDSGRGRVIMSLPARVPALDNAEVAASIAVIDLGTGGELWNYPPAGTVVKHLDVVFEAAEDGHQDATAVINTVGDDLLLDLTTGRSAPLPPVFDTDTVALVDKLLLVVAGGPVNGELRAYDRYTLRPQWTTAGDFDGTVDRCGPWLCATTVFGNTIALDPATGEVRWRLTSAAVRPVPRDRAVVLPTRSGGQGYVGVLQPSTGRMLAKLDGWYALGGATARGPALRPAYPSMLPVLRPHPDGQVELAVLDTDRMMTHRLGRFRAVYAGASQPCASSSRYLVCRADDGARVWRIGPTPTRGSAG